MSQELRKRSKSKKRLIHIESYHMGCKSRAPSHYFRDLVVMKECERSEKATSSPARSTPLVES